MSTIKSTIENFLYPFIDRYTEKIALGGEETVIEGISVLNEDSAFTHGALIHATVILYVHYEKQNDPRSAIILERLYNFIDIISKRPRVYTWGKLGVLRGLYKLKKAGLLSKIDGERLSALAYLTDYEDFLDKETLELKKYPTNYYHVALACAAYREKIGFDTGTLSDKIEEKLMAVSFSEGGSYMDDEPGYARYDRYSLMLASEISDLYRDLERPLPKCISDNLSRSAEHMLFMANIVGDGFNYGRSLSVHGDLAPAEILSSALSREIIKEDDRPLAISYIFAILQKTIYFWYNARKDSFDIWWDGRTTNDYRQIHRLLEVNMDMVSHLHALYDNLATVGLEECKISANMPSPMRWEYNKIDFDGIHSAYILRYKDTLCMIPFIGTKVWGLVAAYNSIPHINGYIEASPESTLPFLTPEYTDKGGKKYRPSHFTKETLAERIDDGLLITARGNLMCVDETRGESDIEYTQEIHLSNNEITVEFEVSREFIKAEMYSGISNDSAIIRVGGFQSSERLEILDNNDFKTPHGAYSEMYLHTSQTPTRLGYKANLDI